MEVAELKQSLGELSDRADAIQNNADQAKRSLTEEEAAEIEKIFADFETTETEIARREKIAAQAQRVNTPVGRKSEPQQPQNSSPRETPAPQNYGSAPRAEDRAPVGRQGFTHIGEFFSAVRNHAIGRNVDQRLFRNAASSTYQSETIGEDGGFAVPPDWRSEISSLLIGEDSLLARCDQQTTSSNSLTVPIDETQPWHSANVQAYWLDEAGTKTETKQPLSLKTVRAHKLAAVVTMSDELLEDSPAMGRYVQSKAPIAIQWAVNNAIINGNGVGKPLGILNAPCLVSVAEEASQVDDTIVANNLYKMWARMPDVWRRNAVWLINQDIEPQLYGLTTIVKNVAGSENVGGGTPLYMPPGGISASPYGTIFGRPVVTSEACGTIGDKGDIILANLGMYLALVKGGIKTDTSIHVYFMNDQTAFRFVLRVGGQPWLSAPVARNVGSNTFSPFVTLDAR